MNSKSRLYGAAGAAALASCLSSPVLAAGTTQGTVVKNEVSISYQVGGNAQTAAVASDEFKVDRKVSMTLANSGTAATQVAPNGTAAIAFQLTNTSNDVLDFSLAASNGGTAKHGTTDNYDVSAFEYYVENGAAGFQGDELKTSTVDNLAADASRIVYVVAKTPQDRVTGNGAVITLVATALSSTGAALQQDAANTAEVETVFADDLALAAGNADRRDGKVKDTGDYTVKGASVTATKTSTLLNDPVNGTTGPRAIPGAEVQYCIAVTNGANAADATNVVLTDTIDGDTEYVDNSMLVGTSCTDAAATARTDVSTDGDGASANKGTGAISATLPTIGATQTQALRFRAKIR